MSTRAAPPRRRRPRTSASTNTETLSPDPAPPAAEEAAAAAAAAAERAGALGAGTPAACASVAAAALTARSIEAASDASSPLADGGTPHAAATAAAGAVLRMPSTREAMSSGCGTAPDAARRTSRSRLRLASPSRAGDSARVHASTLIRPSQSAVRVARQPCSDGAAVSSLASSVTRSAEPRGESLGRPSSATLAPGAMTSGRGTAPGPFVDRRMACRRPPELEPSDSMSTKARLRPSTRREVTWPATASLAGATLSVAAASARSSRAGCAGKASGHCSAAALAAAITRIRRLRRYLIGRRRLVGRTEAGDRAHRLAYAPRSPFSGRAGREREPGELKREQRGEPHGVPPCPGTRDCVSCSHSRLEVPRQGRTRFVVKSCGARQPAKNLTHYADRQRRDASIDCSIDDLCF